jgi:hypothetical protein
MGLFWGVYFLDDDLFLWVHKNELFRPALTLALDVPFLSRFWFLLSRNSFLWVHKNELFRPALTLALDVPFIARFK